MDHDINTMKKENINITRGDTMVSPLISAKELNAILGKSNIKVFDVRGAWGTDPRSLYNDYLWGHIPTAIFLDWRKEFIEQDVVPSLAQISSFEQAKQSFKNLGIHKEDTVILYDDHYHMFAGRIWWAMRYWVLRIYMFLMADITIGNRKIYRSPKKFKIRYLVLLNLYVKNI